MSDQKPRVIGPFPTVEQTQKYEGSLCHNSAGHYVRKEASQ